MCGLERRVLDWTEVHGVQGRACVACARGAALVTFMACGEGMYGVLV